MDIIAHTMEYCGEAVHSELMLRNYTGSDYKRYKKAYEACFSEMRTALCLNPVNCCSSEKKLLQNSGSIFIYEENGILIGSVAVYGNEIDDLFVAKEFQKKGYGEELLRFALYKMQKAGVTPIVIHVADWNRGAVKLYQKNGFKFVKTEVVR